MHHVKLTDTQGRTRWQTQWGPNVRHEARQGPVELCTNTAIHFYSGETLQEALALAAHMNPIQGGFSSPKAWVFEPEGEVVSDGTQSGCKAGTTGEEVALPNVTLEQRAEVVVRCALKVYFEESWVEWAEKWLSGEDRSEEAAWEAAMRVWEAEGVERTGAWAADAATGAAKAANIAAWALTRDAARGTAVWAEAWAAEAAGAALHLDADVGFTKIAVEVYYREAPQ